MDDIELENIFKRLGKTLIIILVFAIIFTLVLINRFKGSDVKELKLIKEKKDAIILVRKNKCDNCKEIINELKKLNIAYEEINSDKERYYDTFLKKLNIKKIDIVEPTILSIKEGVIDSIYVDINDLEELREYLNNIEFKN